VLLSLDIVFFTLKKKKKTSLSPWYNHFLFIYFYVFRSRLFNKKKPTVNQGMCVWQQIAIWICMSRLKSRFHFQKVYMNVETQSWISILFCSRKLTKCVKHLWMFRHLNTNFLIQAYIQTIYVRNMKYKQCPN